MVFPFPGLLLQLCTSLEKKTLNLALHSVKCQNNCVFVPQMMSQQSCLDIIILIMVYSNF